MGCGYFETDQGWRKKLCTDPNATFAGLVTLFTFFLAIFALLQVRISADTAKKQLRAHVGLVKWDLELSSTMDKSHQNGSGQIYENFLCATLQNFGPTLANDVVYIGYVFCTQFGCKLPDNFDFYIFKDTQTIADGRGFTSRFMLAPGQSEISKVPITDRGVLQAIEDAKRGQRAVYVWGRVYYRDIYGRPWRTRVCHAWEPWHPGGARFVPYETHNGEDQEELKNRPNKIFGLCLAQRQAAE
jgi:hypothetical protein